MILPPSFRSLSRLLTRTGTCLGATLFALTLMPHVLVAQSSFDRSGFKGNSSEKAAKEDLQRFRDMKLGDTCLRFTITHVPRKSDKEVVHKGVVWTTHYGDGPVFRMELTPAESGKTLRLILKGGPSPALWLNDGKGQPTVSSNKPFLPGLIFTPFELQTPFVYWQDARYLQTQRFRGRPVLVYQMNPPPHFKTAHPDVGFVRISLDRQFGVIMQTVVYDTEEKEVRKYEAETFTEVNGIYIPEELRVLDVATRDKDVFRVNQAAVRLKHDMALFTPDSLENPAPQPPEADFVRIN